MICILGEEGIVGSHCIMDRKLPRRASSHPKGLLGSGGTSQRAADVIKSIRRNVRRECGHRVHLLILISLVPLRALVPAAFGDPASHGYLLKDYWRRLLVPTKLFLAGPYLFLSGMLLWLSEFEVELSAPEIQVNRWHLMLLDGLFRHEPLLSLVLLLLGVTQLSLLDLLVLDRRGSRKHHKIGV
jgi:hypothetical protein